MFSRKAKKNSAFRTAVEILGSLLVVFLLFGMVIVPATWSQWTPAVLAYALLSLTIARMLPVALGLAGCFLPEIQEGGLTTHEGQHEAAATDIARLGVGNGQREGCRDSCIDGIAAVGNHLP